MTRARRALGPIAAVWLVCQASTLTLVPTALWFGTEASVADCTCTHDGATICPMHHKTAAGSMMCAIQALTPSPAAMLSSVLGAVGLVPLPTRAIVLAPATSVTPVEPSMVTRRASPPDPPPPRA